METLKLGKSDLTSSRLIYGCMRIVGDNSNTSREKGKQAVLSAYQEGYTHFDHADIYGDGRCEELFSEVLKEMPEIRENILITSKCGIVKNNNPNPGDPFRYDFSKAYIIKSVEGSLSRIKIDTLDILLLHRPDYLFQAEEVGSAFEELKASGKVRYFGVSNFIPSQFSLLQSFCPMPLILNQIEINIYNIDTLLDGTLDQCQELNITPQAWSPMKGVAYPASDNTFSEETEARIKAEFNLQAQKYGTDHTTIMLSWLLIHPTKMTPIIGSTNPTRIQTAKQALDLDYTREDWYRLFEARNGNPVP